MKQVSTNGPLVKVQRQSLLTPPSSLTDSGARSSLISSTLELNSDDDFDNEYITFLSKQLVEIVSY